MIQQISHIILYVLSGRGAQVLYRNLLGFAMTPFMGKFSLADVWAKNQPDMEIACLSRRVDALCEDTV